MRIRTIKPEFWKSQTMSALPAETRLLAIGLLNYADDEGYFVAHPALIRGELMPFEESHGRIPGMLQELEEAGYIQLGEDTRGQRVGRVVNFKAHQVVSKPSASKLRPLCQFPPLSPFIPGIVAEAQGNAAGAVRGDSRNAPGGLSVGMEGNGKGMEGNRGAGAPMAPEPLTGSVLAGSSMGEQTGAGGSPEGADLEHPAPDSGSEKKERGRAVFPEDLAPQYRFPLEEWWHYKRERREGYKARGWAALVERERQFPPGAVAASVRASMANGYSGLFTEKHAEAYGGAKKKEGAAGGAVPVIEARPVELPAAPEGWEMAMEALFGPDWREHHGAFETMRHADQRQVRAWLAQAGGEKKKGGAA